MARVKPGDWMFTNRVLPLASEGGSAEPAVVVVVAGQRVGLALRGHPDQVLDAFAVLGEDQPASCGEHGDVVRPVEVAGVGRRDRC